MHIIDNIIVIIVKHKCKYNLIVVANTSPENIGIKQSALAMKNLAVIPSIKINHCMTKELPAVTMHYF